MLLPEGLCAFERECAAGGVQCACFAATAYGVCFAVLLLCRLSQLVHSMLSGTGCLYIAVG